MSARVSGVRIRAAVRNAGISCESRLSARGATLPGLSQLACVALLILQFPVTALTQEAGPGRDEPDPPESVRKADLEVQPLVQNTGVEAGGGADELSACRDAWIVQRSEIQSARIVMSHRNGVSSEPVDWPDVQTALGKLAQAEISGDSTAIRQAVTDCVTTLQGPTRSGEWPVLTIIVDGDSVRNTVEIQGEVKGDQNYHKGSSVRHFPNFHAATIDPGASEEGRYGISYIRPVPDSEGEWRILPDESTTDRLLLEMPIGGSLCRLMVDRRTHMLLRTEIAGSSVSVRGGYSEFAGGIVIPTFGIKVGMGQDGHVRAVDAFLVEHAEFNLPVNESDLAISVPERTRIVDRRDPEGDRIGFSARPGDPLELAREIPAPKPPPAMPPQAARSGFWPVLSVNAALLGVVVVIMVVRRRSALPRS